MIEARQGRAADRGLDLGAMDEPPVEVAHVAPEAVEAAPVAMDTVAVDAVAEATPQAGHPASAPAGTEPANWPGADSAPGRFRKDFAKL